jgi:iron(II)-dependent oxidoreductase
LGNKGKDGLPAMIHLREGWFWMGSDQGRPPEAPRHRVFTDAFRISATTVTRSEYALFLNATGRARPRGWDEPVFENPDQPVVGVNWFDAVAYCEWLSERSGSRFRLPWEAEWEKACRGGVDGMPYAWGREPPELLEYFQGAWPGPRPVAEAPPNRYGLFNMGDNVHEWCADWYAPDYYATSPSRNPRGPESGARRVSRGGSWRHAVKASRAAGRSSLPPDYAYTDYGFRLAESVAGLPV